MTASERPPDPYDLVQEQLRPAVATLLETLGPLPLDDLYGLLHRAGLFAPIDAEGGGDDHRWMIEDLTEFGIDGFHLTGDDVIASVRSIVDGMVLSHVLTPSEQRRSLLDLGLDLCVITAFRHRYQLASGGEVKVARSYPTPELKASARALGFATDDEADPHGSLAGPSGWLDPFAVGDVLTVGVSGRTLAVGRTHLRCLPPLARSPLVVALDLAARHRTEEAYDEYVVLDGYPDHLVLDALSHDPTTLLRSPDLPVATAFGHLGIEWDGDTLIRRHPNAASGGAGR